MGCSDSKPEAAKGGSETIRPNGAATATSPKAAVQSQSVNGTLTQPAVGAGAGRPADDSAWSEANRSSSGGGGGGVQSQPSNRESLGGRSSGKGALTPLGVWAPSTDFRTPELRKELAKKYNMPVEEVQEAMDFAESEDFADVYCFAYCITGGPMNPVAFKVAGLQGMEKEAILQWTTSASEDIRPLNPEERVRQEKARRIYLLEQAIEPALEATEFVSDGEEDIEELTEAYRAKFEEDTRDKTVEETMAYFGVPECSRVAIHKHLHPNRGMANASADEIARRKAAHPVALEKFDSQDD